MALLGQGLLRPQPAATGGWEEAYTIDWSAQSSADLTGGGTVVSGGVTWTAENGGNAAVLGPDGSTGLVIEADTACTILGGTCPGLYAPMDDIVPSSDRHTEVLVLIRCTLTSDRGNVGGTLRKGSEYLFGGPRYVAVWEGYALAATNEFTDYSTALTARTDCVIGLHYRQGCITVEDHGAWSGSWPTGPGGTELGTIGENASTNKTATIFDFADLSTTVFGLLAFYSTGATTDWTIHATRFLVRGVPA